MRLRDKKDIHTKQVVELKKMLKDATSQLVKRNLDLQMGKLKNTAQMRSIRDEIALIKTVLKQKGENKNG